MESNRQFQQEGDENGVQTLAHHSKRKREDSQQSEPSSTIIKCRSLFPLTITEIVACVESLTKKSVSEELDRALLGRRIISNIESGICEAKSFRLVFMNELPAKIFTHSKVEAKDRNPIEVALYDIRSESIVDEGSLSSLKIEICVLHSDFGSDGTEDWSADDFKAKIVRPRDNKGPLLKGDRTTTLHRGLATIPNLEFTDNSKWTRRGRFRLGAIAVQSKFHEPINIREAITAPIVVRDRRGERNQKHFPPSPSDEVWRLCNIAKDGKIHNQLSSHQIYTVGDLLQLHETNPSYLQKVFGETNTTKKKREAIIEHAKTSVAEVTFGGQNYNSQNILNSDSRGLVAVETAAHDLGSTWTGIQTVQHGAPDQGLQLPLFPIEEIPGPMMLLNWSAVSTSVDDGNGFPISESDIAQFARRADI